MLQCEPSLQGMSCVQLLTRFRPWLQQDKNLRVGGMNASLQNLLAVQAQPLSFSNVWMMSRHALSDQGGLRGKLIPALCVWFCRMGRFGRENDL